MKKLYASLSLLLFVGALNAQTTQRLPLVEVFTSNTCGPCASFNGPYQTILDANNPNQESGAGVAVVKYQMNWPSPGTDPSYMDDGDIRKGFYSVSGIPSPWIDGASNSGQQSDIDASQSDPAQLIVEAAYTESGQDLDIYVRVTPLADLGAGSRVFVAIVNNSYGYTGGTNGETDFYFVARKVLPTGAGEFMSPLQTGDVQAFNFQYTYNVASGTPSQMSNDLWNSDYSIVAWVQRSTGSKEVWNATIAYEGLLDAPTEKEEKFEVNIYPNPTTEQANIVFDAENGEDVIMEVYNSMGALVRTESHSGLSGRQTLELQTADLSAGLYQVRVMAGDRVTSQSLMVE